MTHHATTVKEIFKFLLFWFFFRLENVVRSLFIIIIIIKYFCFSFVVGDLKEKSQIGFVKRREEK